METNENTQLYSLMMRSSVGLITANRDYVVILDICIFDEGKVYFNLVYPHWKVEIYPPLQPIGSFQWFSHEFWSNHNAHILAK